VIAVALVPSPATLVAYHPFNAIEPVAVAKLVCVPTVLEIAPAMLAVPSVSKLCVYELIAKLLNEIVLAGAASTFVTVKVALAEV
jgi:hypothetical protein